MSPVPGKDSTIHFRRLACYSYAHARDSSIIHIWGAFRFPLPGNRNHYMEQVIMDALYPVAEFHLFPRGKKFFHPD